MSNLELFKDLRIASIPYGRFCLTCKWLKFNSASPGAYFYCNFLDNSPRLVMMRTAQNQQHRPAKSCMLRIHE